jgi:predicted small metal-binding protein
LGKTSGMRTIECNTCGELITANDDEELLGRLKDHLAEEHDESVDDDELQQTIDRDAYDAVDS